MDSLYIAWSDDRQAATPRSLRDWIAQYPNFADELTRWTVTAPMMDYADTLPTDAEGEARIAALGTKLVAEMRSRYSARPAVPGSLLQAAKAQGMNLKGFAQQIGVGLTIASKLENRMIRAATVPQELVRRIAETLSFSTEQVRAYLQQPAQLAAGAMYKANGVPQVAEPQDFAEAIQAAREMTAKEKTYWLEMD